EKPGSGNDRGGHGAQSQAGRLVMAEAKSVPAKAIEVVDIVKRYGNFTAVDGVSFHVAEGEVFGLLGPNGAGKSTLIRMMTTLLEITSGNAYIESFDVSKQANQARRAIGGIPQAMTSDGDLTRCGNLTS